MTFLRARSRAGARGAFSALRLPVAAFALLTGLLAGCSPNTYEYGTPLFTVHSSSAGFTSYRMGITAIEMTRDDGFLAYPLYSPVPVDLAQLDDHVELLGAPAMPTGNYTSMYISLDTGGLTPLAINVNVNGSSVPVTLTAPYLVNTAGSAIAGGTITLTVTFDPNHPLVITHQKTTRVDLDLNLEASTLVNTSAVASGTSPTVVYNPIVTPTFGATDTPTMRARGLMVVVQPDQSNFIMNLRPYTQLAGAMIVQVTPQTTYYVEGKAYTGADGLNALNQLEINDFVLVYGTLADPSTDGITPVFNATAVQAGYTLENSLQSQVEGTVAAITPTAGGETLTVKGAVFTPNDLGSYRSAGYCYPQYVASLPVKIDSTTAVVRDTGAGPAPGLSSVSVGQKIVVTGQPFDADGNLALSCLDVPVPTSFDATLTAGTAAYAATPIAGTLRLQDSSIWGTLNSATPGSAQLNLVQLGVFSPPVFDFTGTNSSPTAYVVDTGATDLSQQAPGSLLRLYGSPTPFGSAPPDFTASAVTTPTQQQLIVEWWNPPTTTGAVQPFTNVSSTGGTGATLLLDSAEPRLTRHVLLQGLASTNITTLPTIAPVSGATFAVGNAVIGESLYSDVAAFEAQVAKLMAASTSTSTIAFTKLVAVGQFDATSNTFNATQVMLAVQ